MPHRLRDPIRSRADDRCEYCSLPQSAEPLFTFHVEHVVARQHGGSDELDNLAWACHHCNRYKGPNLTGIDPLTGATERLFHPRIDSWLDHFERRDGEIVGLSSVGRTTVHLLRMNDSKRLELRIVWESERED